MAWDEQNIIGRNTPDNGVSTANVTANRDGSLLERSEFIISMITGGAADLRVSQSVAGTVEEGGLLQFTVGLMDVDTGAIASANIDITAITQTMERSRGGAAWSPMTAPSFSKMDGQVYCSYEFLAAEWQTGDMYRATLTGVKCTIGGATVYVPAMVWSNIVVETGDIKTTVEAIQTKLATGVGQPQVFTKSVTSAANAGDVTLATVGTAPVIIDKICVTAVSASQTDLTSAAVYGGASKVITFLDTTDMAKANIDAADECVGWEGAQRLGTGKTIVMTLAGTGATPVNLLVSITYHAETAGGVLA